MAEKLQFIIDAQNRTDAAFKKVKGNVDGLQGKLKTLKPTFQKMALIGTAAFAAISVGVFKATQSAVDAQEIFNKFDVVFGDVGDKADEVAKNLRDNWGLAQSSAEDLLSSTGDLLTGLGMTGDEALIMSEKTQKMAIDLASFTNLQGGAARASRIMTKGLLGERESLKELGVVIKEEDIKTRLAAEGKEELAGMALMQARAEITLQMITEQSKNAMGDYARTADSVANQQRVLKERTKELSESIGTVFIPIMKSIIDKAMPVVEKLGAWIEKNPELTKTIIIVAAGIAGLVAVIGGLGLILPAIITGVGLLGGAIAFIASPIGIITLLIVALILAGYNLYKNWAEVSEMLKDTWRELKDKIVEVWDSIEKYFSDTWKGIKLIWTDAIDALMNKIQPLLDAYEAVKSGAKWAGEQAGKAGDWMYSKLEGRQQGGYIPETKPYLLHKGETVIPAGGGAGAITVNIMGGNYLDREAGVMFGRQIADELKRNIKI